MDENTVEFNCLRKSNRWPMIVNYNMLNIATNNAFILMKASQSGYTGTKVTFLQNLTFQLSQSYVRGRKLTGEKLVMARRLGYAPVVQEQPQRQVQKRKRCYACGVTFPHFSFTQKRSPLWRLSRLNHGTDSSK
jgi:hypothetical protein